MADETKPCRWGLWSTGRIAEKFAADLASVAGAARHSVMSRSLKSAADFARRHRFVHAFEDEVAFLTDPDLDVVYIASPHTFHRDQALRAIAAGKHLLIEKPIAMTAADANAITAAADKAEVFVMEALWTRFLPAVQRAKALIDKGAIGTVKRAEASLHFHKPFDAGHRLFDPALGGGVLHDLGVYPVSLARHLLGPLSLQESLWQAAPSGVSDFARMKLLARGVPVIISCGFTETLADVGENTFVVYGSKGVLRIDRHFLSAESLTLWEKPLDKVPSSRGLGAKIAKRIAFDGRKTERFERQTNGLNHEAAAVQAAIHQGWHQHPSMPLAESAEVLAIIEAVSAQPPAAR